MRSLLVLLVPVVLLAGCASPQTKPLEGATDALPMEVEAVAPLLLELKGHTMVGAADIFAHQLPFEEPLWNAQQAGWLVEVTGVPEAIEVRVDWEGDATYQLHPHYYIGDDEAGVTQYYGYHSELFTTSPGCIRLTPEDMAEGVWPVMIHPGEDVVMGDFTLTVGVVGAQAQVLPEMHGHRADMNWEIEEHEVSPCEFLLDMPMAHSH